ncbi:MAG TPA: DUF4232 domain-containing protein [Gaiellaceae bacterium]|nr:DUF4232 domain-containing protein [Gaiellaceae bacterium]
MLAPPRPPSPDEREALIREARARQLRRRLLGAAGVAIASAIALSVYALTIGGDGQGALAGGSASGGVPECTARQLSATAALTGATGSMDGFATLTNTGATTCSLPAAPPRVTISWRGEQMPARQKTFVGSGGAPIHALAPGQAALVHLDWSEWCGDPGAGAVIRPTFRLRFGGLVVAARARQMSPPRCDVPGLSSTILVGPPVSS